MTDTAQENIIRARVRAAEEILNRSIPTSSIAREPSWLPWTRDNQVISQLNRRVNELLSQFNLETARAKERAQQLETEANIRRRAETPNVAVRHPGEDVNLGRKPFERRVEIGIFPVVPQLRVSPGLLEKIEREGLQGFREGKVEIISDFTTVKIPILWNPLGEEIAQVGNEIISRFKEERFGWKVTSIRTEGNQVVIEMFEVGSIPLIAMIALVIAILATVGIIVGGKYSVDSKKARFEADISKIQAISQIAGNPSLTPQEKIELAKALDSGQDQGGILSKFTGAVGAGSTGVVIAIAALLVFSR